MPRFRAKLAAVAATAALAALGSLAPAAQSHAQAPLRWVALGDSYTAGVIHAAGHTYEEPRDGCQRTTGSYPQVIAHRLGGEADLTDVSCGNATIADIAHTRQAPIGYELHIPGLADIHDPEYPFEQVARQIEAVRQDTGAVTIGIGGNSLGFGEILGRCVELGRSSGIGSTPCRDHYTSGRVETIPVRLARLADDYADMLERVHRRAPHARIITVGYPTIIPETVTNCLFGNPLQFATIRHGDLTWLRQSVLEPLNSTIARVTRENGDTFVDLYGPSRGHSVCALGTGKWVEGIKERLDGNDDPDSWALVHPNSRGQANAARLVEHALAGAPR